MKFKCNCDVAFSGDLGCYRDMHEEHGLCYACYEAGHTVSFTRPILTMAQADAAFKELNACQTPQQSQLVTAKYFTGPLPSAAVNAGFSLPDWATTPNLPQQDFNRLLREATNSNQPSLPFSKLTTGGL